MTPSVDLFNLIKSLTKAEKRAFTLLSSSHDRNKAYLRLFEAIDNQSIYNESKIKKKFANDSVFVNQLAFWKNYLYKQLLKNLSKQKDNENVESQVSEMLLFIRALIKKGLYDQCSKLIKKAKNLAQKHELFEKTIELCSYERIIFTTGAYQKENQTAVAKTLKLENETLKKLITINKYIALNHELAFSYNQSGQDRKAVKRIYNSFIKTSLLSEKSVDSKASYVIFLEAHSHLNYITGSYEKALVFQKKIIKLLESNVHLIQKNPARYIMFLSNMLVLLDYTKNKKEFDITFNKFTTYVLTCVSVPTEYKIRFILMAYTTITNTYLLNRDYNKIIALIKNESLPINVFIKNAPVKSKMLLYYNITYTYFILSDYRNALKTINVIINENVKRYRVDIQIKLRLLNFLIHFELGNYELLQPLVLSTLRFFSKQTEETIIETKLIRFIAAYIVKYNQKKQLSLAFTRFKKEVIDKQFIPKSNRNLMEYFDVTTWIDSKIENKPYTEILKRKMA